jgi:glycosyltransferase involved in cell wall biosynthesis
MNHISIVIPTLNSAKTLKDCLNAIRNLSDEYSVNSDVIIVDAGSTDETIAISKEYTQKIVVSKGVSRGKARNIGAENASADSIVFLDSDCVITPEWIKHLLSLPEDTFSTVIAGPAVLVEAETTVGSAIKEMLSSRLFTLSSYTFSLDSTQREVFDVPSSNVLVSKKFFEQVSGFPDLNFNEDGVFCTRVISGKGKIVYYPSFKVIHKKTFNSYKKFSSYFFKYGESYGRNLRPYPSLLNRYAIIATFLVVVMLISLVTSILFDLALLTYFGLFTVSCVAVLLCYSLLHFQKKRAMLIPFLFITLFVSYLTGFYYGILTGYTKIH